MDRPPNQSEYHINSVTGVRSVNSRITEGAAFFTPSSYGADLTMDGTAQSGALATGALKLQVANLGATTEAIRVAFGTSASNAENNLGMTVDGAPERATTGYYIPASAEGESVKEIGIPANATHYAVANAVDSDVQTVIVNQGI